jgi:hypothetical protein
VFSRPSQVLISRIVSPARRCSRTACSRPAVATLTYVYADSTAVLGPLAAYSEPHSYDLCTDHSTRLTAPRGWAVLRLATPDPGPSQPSSDDLEALANAVREAARGSREAGDHRDGPQRGGGGSGGHGGSGPGASHGLGPGGGPGAAEDTDGQIPGPGGRRNHLRAIPNPDR